MVLDELILCVSFWRFWITDLSLFPFCPVAACGLLRYLQVLHLVPPFPQLPKNHSASWHSAQGSDCSLSSLSPFFSLLPVILQNSTSTCWIALPQREQSQLPHLASLPGTTEGDCLALLNYPIRPMLPFPQLWTRRWLCLSNLAPQSSATQALL